MSIFVYDCIWNASHTSDPHSDAGIKYIAAQTKFPHPHTPPRQSSTHTHTHRPDRAPHAHTDSWRKIKWLWVHWLSWFSQNQSTSAYHSISVLFQLEKGFVWQCFGLRVPKTKTQPGLRINESHLPLFIKYNEWVFLALYLFDEAFEICFYLESPPQWNNTHFLIILKGAAKQNVSPSVIPHSPWCFSHGALR